MKGVMAAFAFILLGLCAGVTAGANEKCGTAAADSECIRFSGAQKAALGGATEGSDAVTLSGTINETKTSSSGTASTLGYSFTIDVPRAVTGLLTVGVGYSSRHSVIVNDWVSDQDTSHCYGVGEMTVAPPTAMPSLATQRITKAMEDHLMYNHQYRVGTTKKTNKMCYYTPYTGIASELYLTRNYFSMTVNLEPGQNNVALYINSENFDGDPLTGAGSILGPLDWFFVGK